VQEYFPGIIPAVQITPGIHANERFNLTALGLIYAEILQLQGRFEDALAVIEEIDSDQMTAISMADIEISLKRFDDAIATTEDVENIDDATAMLLILRGIAFREQNFLEASLECLKQAIAKRTRSEMVLNRGLWERAYTYERMGKKAMAKKDLEKILSREPAYSGLTERLSTLNS
jgi:tetratricopeptide (TPR) repeat protein